MDQLWAKSKARIRQWEQFALSFVFEQNMQELREAGDVVFHYWPPHAARSLPRQVAGNNGEVGELAPERSGKKVLRQEQPAVRPCRGEGKCW